MVRLPTWQCFRAGGNDSGGGGKGLSMVELGLWDKNGVEKPVTCLGGKMGGKSCFEFNREGFGGLPTLAPQGYRGVDFVDFIQAFSVTGLCLFPAFPFCCTVVSFGIRTCLAPADIDGDACFLYQALVHTTLVLLYLIDARVVKLVSFSGFSGSVIISLLFFSCLTSQQWLLYLWLVSGTKFHQFLKLLFQKYLITTEGSKTLRMIHGAGIGLSMCFHCSCPASTVYGSRIAYSIAVTFCGSAVSSVKEEWIVFHEVRMCKLDEVEKHAELRVCDGAQVSFLSLHPVEQLWYQTMEQSS
ncbi:hypothetical protein Tco_1549539 [Tanacetum coccineum]